MKGYRARARREILAVVMFVALAFVIGISLVTPLMPARAATNHVVDMTSSYTFDPVSTTVAPGDTVTWHNLALIPHTATSNTTAWPEVIVSGGGTSAAIAMPMTPGTYPYICTFHFGTTGMWGEIVVSNNIPEFSSSFVVVAGILVMALGLMLARRRP